MQRPILVWRRPGRNGPSSRLIILHSIALLCWLYYRFCRPELSTVPRELVVRLHVQKNSIAQHDTTQHSTNAVPGSPIPSSSSVLPFRRRPISLPRPTLDGDSNPWRWAKSHQTTCPDLFGVEDHCWIIVDGGGQTWMDGRARRAMRSDAPTRLAAAIDASDASDASAASSAAAVAALELVFTGTYLSCSSQGTTRYCSISTRTLRLQHRQQSCAADAAPTPTLTPTPTPTPTPTRSPPLPVPWMHEPCACACACARAWA